VSQACFTPIYAADFPAHIAQVLSGIVPDPVDKRISLAVFLGTQAGDFGKSGKDRLNVAVFGYGQPHMAGDKLSRGLAGCQLRGIAM
jgi:hypothetical protein